MSFSPVKQPLDSRRNQVWLLHVAGITNTTIAKDVGVSVTTVRRWIHQGEPNFTDERKRSGRNARLGDEDLRLLGTMLQIEAEQAEVNELPWGYTQIVACIEREFNTTYHKSYIPQMLRRVRDAQLRHTADAFATSNSVTLYLGNALDVLKKLPSASIDCIVTSPPYYGQRDYGVPDQIGLEELPQLYINRLVAIFQEAKRTLKPTGSLWVNLGDTYWSGKGRPSGPDKKQKHRRFLRPQDRSGPRPLCTPKQLLLIPHRFAIAMQDDGWIVRNDNVWSKVNPTPDPAEDRSAAAHEYMFHFVLQRKYYYNFGAVAVPSNGERPLKSPSSVWQIPISPNFKKHIAVFPEALVRIPILATLPPGGVLLDPFCGSGTALNYAVTQGDGRRAIGIDISETALEEAVQLTKGNTK